MSRHVHPDKKIGASIEGPKPSPAPASPLFEGPLQPAAYRELDSPRLFQLARNLLRSRGLHSAQALSDSEPGLYAELRSRDMLDHLSISLTASSIDQSRLEKQVTEVFSRQGIHSTPEEIQKLVALIPALYTLPDFLHVKYMAEQAGIPLSDDEITKMVWVLRAYMKQAGSP